MIAKKWGFIISDLAPTKGAFDGYFNMKNPFVKEDHTGLYIGIAIGAAAGITLGWLYLTDSGAQYRRQLTRKVKEAVSDTAAEVIDKKTIVPKKVAKVATDAVIKD